MTGSNNTIGGLTSTPGTGPGNVISGSGKYSILATGSGILIEGNLVGTDATGSFAIANFIGMRLQGTNNTVGGTATGARNVISAAGGVGVQFDGAVLNIISFKGIISARISRVPSRFQTVTA